MNLFDELDRHGHEQVLFCHDAAAGYRGIIAIHSTVLGPAVGGTRYWHYESEAGALRDVLRLSRGMTYKNALAGLPLGGGKAIILDDGRAKNREALFRAHGRFVDRLGGLFVTAEDVGTTPADMASIHAETEHVAGLEEGGGDPSPWTALGVFRGIQAAAYVRWGSDDLAGRTVAIQGCGNVGSNLADLLSRAGATLLVSDVDSDRAARVAEATDATVIAPSDILGAEADVFAPCALGAVFDDESIPRLEAGIVAGAANNQLLEPRHGAALAERGILYAPDYVVNAGGVLSGGVDILGWSPDEVERRVDGIFDTVVRVFRRARERGVPPSEAADQLAEMHLVEARRA